LSLDLIENNININEIIIFNKEITEQLNAETNNKIALISIANTESE
jgi:hypothetical protein